jgi:predicted enzyme related to lactoylglutathione lyase
MLNLNSIMIGTHQPKVMAQFYERVFQKPADMEEGGWHGWAVGSTFFSIGEHSEIKGEAKEPDRMIFNLETKKVKEEFERISQIEGIEVIKEPYEMGSAWIATLSDPDGNYFQLMSPWDIN